MYTLARAAKFRKALHCTPECNDVLGHFLICGDICVDLPLVDCDVRYM